MQRQLRPTTENRPAMNGAAYSFSGLLIRRPAINGIVSLHIRPIREGANVTVEDGETGILGFRLARPARRGAATLVRKNNADEQSLGLPPTQAAAAYTITGLRL